MSFLDRWSKVIKATQRTHGPDGIPLRDGLTYEEDRRRVLDMLCLCGELDGLGPGESYSGYLRRLIDEVIRLRRADGEEGNAK